MGDSGPYDEEQAIPIASYDSFVHVFHHYKYLILDLRLQDLGAA